MRIYTARQFTLREVQLCPDYIQLCLPYSLAWLMHEAEACDDDLTVDAIARRVGEKGWQEIFLDAYREVWPEFVQWQKEMAK